MFFAIHWRVWEGGVILVKNAPTLEFTYRKLNQHRFVPNKVTTKVGIGAYAY